jgi:hypothetical protein
MALSLRTPVPQPEPSRETFERLLTIARDNGISAEAQDPRRQHYARRSNGYTLFIRLTPEFTIAELVHHCREGDDCLLHIEWKHDGGTWHVHRSDVSDEIWDRLLPLRASANASQYLPMPPTTTWADAMRSMCHAFLELTRSA